MQRVNAFKEGCEILGEQGKLLKLSMQRMAYLAKDEKEAIELGVDMVEFDVRRTKDGFLVCHHDATIGNSSRS